MGEFLDRPARLSLSLREREGNVGITPDNYQILPPSSNHIYKKERKGLRKRMTNAIRAQTHEGWTSLSRGAFRKG
jgi:hypothetical protein